MTYKCGVPSKTSLQVRFPSIQLLSLYRGMGEIGKMARSSNTFRAKSGGNYRLGAFGFLFKKNKDFCFGTAIDLNSFSFIKAFGLKRTDFFPF